MNTTPLDRGMPTTALDGQVSTASCASHALDVARAPECMAAAAVRPAAQRLDHLGARRGHAIGEIAMNAPLDLLSIAIAKVRPHLDRSTPVRYRIRVFWAGVVAARNLGAADVVSEEFTALGVSSGLAADLGRHADEEIAHVIRWGLLNRDPFGDMS